MGSEEILTKKALDDKKCSQPKHEENSIFLNNLNYSEFLMMPIPPPPIIIINPQLPPLFRFFFFFLL